MICMTQWNWVEYGLLDLNYGDFCGSGLCQHRLMDRYPCRTTSSVPGVISSPIPMECGSYSSLWNEKGDCVLMVSKPSSRLSSVAAPYGCHRETPHPTRPSSLGETCSTPRHTYNYLNLRDKTGHDTSLFQALEYFGQTRPPPLVLRDDSDQVHGGPRVRSGGALADL